MKESELSEKQLRIYNRLCKHFDSSSLSGPEASEISVIKRCYPGVYELAKNRG